MGKRGNGEGSVYQRKSDGKWVGSVTLENRKRKVFYGKTRKEVQDKLIVALREQQQGALVATSKQTLAQFLTDWLENTQKHSVRPRSYERYEEIVRLHIVPVLCQGRRNREPIENWPPGYNELQRTNIQNAGE